MFNKKDFNHIEKMQNSMADGMVDAIDSHMMIENLIDIMSKTDFLSDESRMEMMMHCVNLCYGQGEDEDNLIEDNVFHLVLALCFAYSNVVTNLVIDGFDIADYFSFLKAEVLPVMREESKNLPYWDIDEN